VERKYELKQEENEDRAAYLTRLAEIKKEDSKIEEIDNRAIGIIIENIHVNYRQQVLQLNSGFDI
jgi:uncharacterized tellurite resistance protein B-like protein